MKNSLNIIMIRREKLWSSKKRKINLVLFSCLLYKIFYGLTLFLLNSF